MEDTLSAELPVADGYSNARSLQPCKCLSQEDTGHPSSPRASHSPPTSPGAVRRSPRVVKKSQRALEGEAMEVEPAAAPQVKVHNSTDDC